MEDMLYLTNSSDADSEEDIITDYLLERNSTKPVTGSGLDETSGKRSVGQELQDGHGFREPLPFMVASKRLSRSCPDALENACSRPVLEINSAVSLSGDVWKSHFVRQQSWAAPPEDRPSGKFLDGSLRKSVSLSRLAPEPEMTTRALPVLSTCHVSSNSQMHGPQFDTLPGKTRKRRSLFIRKKKDRVKRVAHEWVSVSIGESLYNCDSCFKPLDNKSALACSHCTKRVHANFCRDEDRDGDCIKRTGSKRLVKSLSLSKRRGFGSLGRGERLIRRCHSNSPTDCSIPTDFPDLPTVPADLNADPFLGLGVKEPESWTLTVDRTFLTGLDGQEIKRQERMYEFIVTEKHHCATLKVMQQVFVEGMRKYCQLDSAVHRMFPRLADLQDIHFRFLHSLRRRQTASTAIQAIGDILLEQFTGQAGRQLKSVYGEICSRHSDAVSIYKYLWDNDEKFGEFARRCRQNPLLEKKGIPECILFVTQRLTKYPLLIEALMKSTKVDGVERDRLQKALASVKEILVQVNAQVAEREREDRQVEIYNKLDVDSFTTRRGVKFKKSDFLSENRKLKFEGTAVLTQGGGKAQYVVVVVVVLTDVLLFLQEHAGKYLYFTPDNSVGVVSLQKLLVREKAGQDSKGLYLIGSHPDEPTMFELTVHEPRDKNVWIRAIRDAVRSCPDDGDGPGSPSSTVEDDERSTMEWEAKRTRVRKIVDDLEQKTREQAHVLEEKMSLQLKLLAASGWTAIPEPPAYDRLVDGVADTATTWKTVVSAVREVSDVARSLRASDKVDSFYWRDAVISALPADVTDGKYTEPGDLPALLTLGREQQLAAVLLSHDVYTLLCVFWQQMTHINSLQAELAVHKDQLRGGRDKDTKTMYKHNQQLEELRNIQDKLNQEKEAWRREKETEEKRLEDMRRSLVSLQVQLKEEQEDIVKQREQLFRKMEVLTSQGYIISPNISGQPTAPCSLEETPQTPLRRKPSTLGKGTNTPPNLVSAANQQKVSRNVHVKQRLPLKLATGSKTQTGSPVGKVQQMLPLRLSQGQDVRRSVMTEVIRLSPQCIPTGYRRLISTNSSTDGGSSAAGVIPAASADFRDSHRDNQHEDNSEERVIFF